MENQIEKNSNNEDEISLIDLFAVLIRYRRLILIITALGAILAGLYLFVLPRLSLPQINNSSSIVYTVKINKLPLSVEKSFNKSQNKENMVLKAFVTDMVKLPVFASVYRTYPFLSVDGELPTSDVESNSIVKNFIDNEGIVLIEDPLKSVVEMTVEVDSANVEIANQFISELVMKVNQELMNYIVPLLKELQRETKQKIAAMDTYPALREGPTDELQGMLSDLDVYLASLESFAFMEFEPFVTVSSLSSTTKAIIIVFAALFISVFIAFLLNAINNVKADPVASKVISDAWKAGK